jgi:ABC-type Fe3+/spermidine/putrescine transport system ATPase subunit
VEPRGAGPLSDENVVDGLSASVGSFRLGPVSFPLRGGEAVAVVGPSGAGKTTLLRALAGFRPPSAGRAVLAGTDRLTLAPERRGIAYVPQGLGLFPHRSVRDNVAFTAQLHGTDRTDPRPTELLARFGLTDFADRRPSTLSTGEQQRVAIARALAARPELLLWDEPLVALDLLARDDLIDALREVQREDRLPIVLVSHDPAIAFSLANRFLLLEAGTVLFQGEPAELQRAPPTPFAARFAGFENVFAREALAGADASFGRWLLDRAGPAGIAFGALPARSQGDGWSATVQRIEPSPQGGRCAAAVDGMLVRLSVDPGHPLRAGNPVTVSVPEESLVCLGPGSP